MLNKYNEIIFLDTSLLDKDNNNSYIFTNPIKIIMAFGSNDLEKAFDEIIELSKKYWVVGYIKYEAIYYFLDDIFKHFPINKNSPIMWFGVYEKPIEITKELLFDSYKPYLNFKNDIDLNSYNEKINLIKNEIKQGNTYQVNFTINKKLQAYCSDENLYFSLRKLQKTSYSAFIKNKFDTILSFSPELFFKIDNNKLTVKPMKGTIARGENKNSDDILIEKLLNDPKINAENLMIVDLLRNDLGVIADKGSVKVENLLDLETHETLHQLTSTISCNIKNVNYFEIFKALFPCGSVTGAPKIETMKIIQSLESKDRGVYCGAIGYISPENKSMFSVPIRTLQKVKNNTWNYKVGGGIVWDSDAKSEWEEINTKTLFVEQNHNNDFKLIETILFDGKNLCFKREHLERIIKSSKFFKFKLNLDLFYKTIFEEEQNLAFKEKKCIFRIEIDKDGVIFTEVIEYSESKTNVVKISDIILDKKNIFLKHKTNYRPWYSKTLDLIKNGVVLDEIFVNQYDEITEGSRSNLFIKIDDVFYTPPKSSGLLNGIFRRNLINNGLCKEQKMDFKYLINNRNNLYIGNSVRGLIKVDLLCKHF